MIYRKLIFLIPIYGILLVSNPLYVYGSDINCDEEPNHKYCTGEREKNGVMFCNTPTQDDCYHRDNKLEDECWCDGYEDGRDHPFDHERNKECKDMGNQYYRAFIHGYESQINDS